jgi:hypothetical protein
MLENLPNWMKNNDKKNSYNHHQKQKPKSTPSKTDMD